MLEGYGIYLTLGVLVIVLLLLVRVWGDAFYIVTKNLKLASFVFVLSLLGVFIVFKQEALKYELISYYYYTGHQSTDDKDLQYNIRQCKNFIQTKMNNEQGMKSTPIKSGLITVATINNNWDFCAKTFGMNYWKHDISINGQNGGRVLCQAYARDTYRSGHVQTWCDTVFVYDQKA